MCSEHNESENVEPSEDLNMVNVHDGTWRECIPRVDSVEVGDCWADTGRIVDPEDVGPLFVHGLWRRIPEHERTPVQQSTELPIPSESIVLSVVSEIGDNKPDEQRILDDMLKSTEPPVMPLIVSEDEDTRPDEQRTLDAILADLQSSSLAEDGTRYATAIEAMRRQFEHGYGIDEHGGLFVIGFTGKRKSLTIAAFRDWMNWSYCSHTFCRFLQRIGKQYPPKIKTALGDDIHTVFEKYRPGSCMSAECCRDMREIYACNPDSVGTVYSVRDTTHNPLMESSCSALFWLGKRRIYLDRMYSSGAQNTYCQYDWFADYLESTYGKPVVPIYTSSKQRNKWDKTITFKLVDSGNPLPYIDNLYTVKKYDGKHVWLTSDESASDIHCRHTSGTYPDGRGQCLCAECGCRVDEDDATTYGDDSYCSDCYADQFSMCDWLEDTYPNDEVQSVECWCSGSLYRERRIGRGYDYSLGWHTLSVSNDALSNYFTELSDGRYASNGNSVEDNRGNTHATDCDSWDNVVLTEDGDLYHDDDVVQLSDGRIYPQDDCVEVDGEWYVSGKEPEQATNEEDDDNGEQATELQKEQVNS